MSRSMTTERASLIEIVWAWSLEAMKRRDADLHRGCWIVLDALYADCAYYRSPEYLSQVEKFLDGRGSCNANTVKRIRKELGMEEPRT